MKEFEIREKVKSGSIRFRMIQEVAGFPKEHVENVLNDLHQKIGSIKGITILEKDVHEAKSVGDKMWSVFSEVELLVDDLSLLFLIIFEATPTSVEILEPEEVRLGLSELNGLISDVLGKIQHLDMAVKALSAENIILKRETKK